MITQPSWDSTRLLCFYVAIVVALFASGWVYTSPMVPQASFSTPHTIGRSAQPIFALVGASAFLRIVLTVCPPRRRRLKWASLGLELFIQFGIAAVCLSTLLYVMNVVDSYPGERVVALAATVAVLFAFLISFISSIAYIWWLWRCAVRSE